ncbi:hypothetical protein IKZ77_01810 [Candidatus Saccharibacteria bacterium]|nr:hypothetical protein [Candidatus Saccharibacteria bacterium]
MPKLGGKIRKIKVRTWWFIILLVPLILIDIHCLRQNHIKMTELRDAVMAADEADDDAEIYTSLVVLKEYVFSEVVINIVEENGTQKITFGTGPFYLEHQYIRAANAALEEAEKNLISDSNPYGNIYGEAGAYCRELAIANGWGYTNANYINCMLDEIAKYPSAQELQTQVVASLPSTELFRHDYASRIWAPTFTGWMLALTVLTVVVIIIRFIIWLVFRITLLFMK